MARRIGDNNRAVMLTADAVRRIGKTVQAYEQGRTDIKARPLRTAYGDDGDSIRLGSISGSWLKGDTATVTRMKGDGTAFTPHEEFEALNHFVDISIDCGSGVQRKVACALVGSTWILIAAECDPSGGS